MNDSVVSFREALSRFASGVVVVTAHTPAGPVGFTASAFASASLEPPLVLVCVGKRASTYAGIVEAPHFGVSVLHAKQEWVAEQFARRQGVERFAGVPLRATASVPIVDGALAELVCSRHARYDAGDHTILVGRVLESRAGTGRPLVHYARTFGGFAAEQAPRQNGARSLPNGEGA
jgi:flavin reductase (DIM6/NTAB) family NADH-FMN oxidoreductase RutF